jgi:hypothetical protein
LACVPTTALHPIGPPAIYIPCGSGWGPSRQNPIAATTRLACTRPFLANKFEHRIIILHCQICLLSQEDFRLDEIRYRKYQWKDKKYRLTLLRSAW